MLLLALLQRWRPRAARRLELLALALPLPDALARLVVPAPFSNAFVHHCGTFAQSSCTEPLYCVCECADECCFCMSA